MTLAMIIEMDQDKFGKEQGSLDEYLLIRSEFEFVQRFPPGKDDIAPSTVVLP